MYKKLFVISIILLGAVLLSACSGPVRGTTWPGLSADNTTAYLADGSFVYAINIKDGREVWHFPAKVDSKLLFYAPPVLTPDGLVIVGSAGNDHSLFALDPANLDPETQSPLAAWTFTAAKDQWMASPLIIGDKLFAPNGDGNLYVLDLDDGQSNKQAVKTIELGGRLWAQPVTDGERVFVTSLDHSVIAVDIETYEILWREEVNGAIPGSATLGTDGMLYVGSLASKLEKFDPLSGEHQTVLETENWIWSAPAVDGDTLYFGDLSGNFYSFNAATATLNWSIKPDGPITANALVQNDHVLLATESGVLYAIGKDGSTLWFEEIGGQLYTTPVVAGDLILVAPLGTDFYLAALNTEGRQVWTFTPER
ncbi:MAG TPA: PQQ-binding-like beta-propeller repeat protein [Anaerolineales bacterium]|nr:PQQ-binding-like beta-propeller repeat protein [Anaerolineales bacterium]